MKKQEQMPGKDKNEDLPGYPIYPASEDIYSQEKKVADVSTEQELDLDNPIAHEPTIPLEVTGDSTIDDGLDVPGSELDNDQEEIGAEDEENNYYSLGGENHEDLEEGNDDLR